MNTYTIDNLSVNISLNAGTIYLKVVDTASFATFETKCEPADLPTTSSIGDTYTLMCNCLAKQIHHNCEFHVENNNMRITFDAKIGGYYSVHFDVFLRERTTTESGKLGAMIARLETRQTAEMEFMRNALKELQRYTDALSFAEINMSSQQSDPRFIPLNTTTLTCDTPYYSINKTHIFPKLKELIVSSNMNQGLVQLKNNTVEKLSFFNISQTIDLSQILANFPNLTTISISPNCSSVMNAKFAIVDTKHGLKNITLPNNTGLIAEITQYCTTNNIILIKQ